jgi:hypothetical protein
MIIWRKYGYSAGLRNFSLGRARRLPRPAPVLTHASHVGSEGFYPRTRRTSARLPRATP